MHRPLQLDTGAGWPSCTWSGKQAPSQDAHASEKYFPSLYDIQSLSAHNLGSSCAPRPRLWQQDRPHALSRLQHPCFVTIANKHLGTLPVCSDRLVSMQAGSAGSGACRCTDSCAEAERCLGSSPTVRSNLALGAHLDHGKLWSVRVAAERRANVSSSACRPKFELLVAGQGSLRCRRPPRSFARRLRAQNHKCSLRSNVVVAPR